MKKNARNRSLNLQSFRRYSSHIQGYKRRIVLLVRPERTDVADEPIVKKEGWVGWLNGRERQPSAVKLQVPGFVLCTFG